MEQISHTLRSSVAQVQARSQIIRYSGFDEDQDFAWFDEHGGSCSALRPCQHKCGSVISLLRMASLLRHAGSVEMEIWLSKTWERLWD